MFFGHLGLLIAASGFLTSVPPQIDAKLSATNEVRGTFVQTKVTPPTERASGRRYVSKGTYRIRPGVDFTWKTLSPFETTFYATPTNYVYSNEDESITRPLKDLPGFDRLLAPCLQTSPASSTSPTFQTSQTFQAFLRTFDALYKEESGRFYLKAKPKVGDLKRALERVDAEGTMTNWVLTATFPNGVSLRLELKDE